jgi:hypothetical protein
VIEAREMSLKGIKCLPGTIPIFGHDSDKTDNGPEQVLRAAALKHTHACALDVANAAATMDKLPKDGHSIHILLSGNFDGYAFIPAILRLADPTTISELYIATLSFNHTTAGRLVELLDTGKVGRLWFVCSHYFQKTNSEIYAPFATALQTRGQHLKATRNHAKLMAFKMSNGKCYTIEGSMNLRGCRCIENCCITASDDVFTFYAGYVRKISEGK